MRPARGHDQMVAPAPAAAGSWNGSLALMAHFFTRVALPSFSGAYAVLPFRPRRYDRWSQSLEVTFEGVVPGGEPPLLKQRRELMRDEAIKLWAQKRRAGWQVCAPLQSTKQSHLAPTCCHKQCV